MKQKLKQDTFSIGRNLRRLRKAKGLTQEDMVRLLQLNDFDISRSVYSKMEIGMYAKYTKRQEGDAIHPSTLEVGDFLLRKVKNADCDSRQKRGSYEKKIYVKVVVSI